MASINGTRRTVISTVVLAAATAVAGVMVVVSSPAATAMPGVYASDTTPAPANPNDMGGMDMGGMDMGGSTPAPAPTMDPDMPGMDMDPGAPYPDVPGTTPAPSPAPAHGSGDMPGMDMPGMDHEHEGTAAVASDRPLAPVLGTFGGGASAVLLSAGLMRRKDRALSLAKKAARVAGRAKK
jgi:hypothetical protein